MKLFCVALLSCLFITTSQAQVYFTISGTVKSATNGQPMAAASVFAQNTTFGTATDEAGNFKLQLPAGGYDLVVTFTGYRTELKRITTADANEKIIFELNEKEKELAAVAVVATNEVADGLEKYGSFFKSAFLGKLAHDSACTIQNPSALHFFFSKKKNRLKVTATEPLVIKNQWLGYNITYNIDSFTHEYNTDVSIYSGYPLFEAMQGDSSQQQIWETNRRIAYKGSLLHFMRSVYNKSLAADGFEIQFITNNQGKENSIVLKDFYGALQYEKDDSTQTVEILPNQNLVAVLYKAEKPLPAYIAENPNEPKDFRLSFLNFKPKESIIIEQNGFFYESNDVTISGYYTWDKVGNQVPYDYLYKP
ncbi:carboxypeptidase-like regulatory domain-containing protein [Ferruginibacter yonginensis]|uniref:Carboxypeptidase-like regulatory domain-containing protein n=1 Tax=Ferruginibacter yonginensis TaxID=1310416 RepID=A0ABV8QSI2_9BACT